jgi:hypothetical protein
LALELLTVLRMRFATVGLLVCAALGVGQGAALAEGTSDSESPDAVGLRLGLQAGLGAPLGFGGGYVEVQPLPWLVADAGVGLGPAGLQEAVTVRPILFDSIAGVDLGLSTGPFKGTLPQWEDSTPHYDRVWWANIDLSLGSQSQGLRGFFGAAVPVAHSAADPCRTTTSGALSCQPDPIFYVGASYSFASFLGGAGRGLLE